MTISCKTCKYAEFPRTVTGRIQRNMPGKCTYEVKLPQLPASVPVRYMSRMAIWFDSGANCPTYEKR